MDSRLPNCEYARLMTAFPARTSGIQPVPSANTSLFAQELELRAGKLVSVAVEKLSKACSTSNTRGTLA